MSYPAPDGAGAGPLERQLDPNSLGDHLDRLYSVALTLCGAREPAEDLVQETYARVLARPRLLRGDDDLAYLVRALRNTWISQGRAAARRPVTRPLPDDLEVLPGAASLEPHARLEADRVRQVILALPEQLRDVLLAVDVAGLSYRDAGRALRIRKATVTGRLHRARRAVMRELEPHEAPAQSGGADSGSVGAGGDARERRAGGAQPAAGGEIEQRAGGQSARGQDARAALSRPGEHAAPAGAERPVLRPLPDADRGPSGRR